MPDHLPLLPLPAEPSPSALQQPSPDEPRAAAEHAPGTPAPPAGIAAGDGGASPFDSAALSSPFGAVASPFGAQDQQASAFGAEEQQAALEGRPPPFAPGGGGAAATAPGAAPAPAAAAEHSAAVSGGEEDEGIELPIPKSAFSFGRSGARKLGHAHSAVAEDAWIDAAVEDEMSPAAGAAPPVAAAAAEAAAAAALAGAAAAQALPQRQHSLRSLGEFEGVSGLIDLSNRLDGAGSGAPRPPLLARLASQLGVLQQQQPASHVAAKQQQQVEQHQQQQQQPEQQQERQPAFGSPLPSVRGSDGVGTPRRSGSAALEALAELQAAQAARSSASTGPDVAAFPSAGAFAALPAAHPPHHPSLPVAQRRRSTSSGGLSGTLSFELGAPHLEVDEKTGEVRESCRQGEGPAWGWAARWPMLRPPNLPLCLGSLAAFTGPLPCLLAPSPPVPTCLPAHRPSLCSRWCGRPQGAAPRPRASLLTAGRSCRWARGLRPPHNNPSFLCGEGIEWCAGSMRQRG